MSNTAALTIEQQESAKRIEDFSRSYVLDRLSGIGSNSGSLCTNFAMCLQMTVAKSKCSPAVVAFADALVLGKRYTPTEVTNVFVEIAKIIYREENERVGDKLTFSESLSAFEVSFDALFDNLYIP